MEDTELTFSAVREIIYPDPYVYGPSALIDDHRFVAGMLFEHYSDRSERRLIVREGEWPYVEIGWHRDFSMSRYKQILVAKSVPEKLLEEHIVEGTPAWGYTDMTKLLLSKRGGRIVLTEWFIHEELSIVDAIAAGASYDLRTSRLVWSE